MEIVFTTVLFRVSLQTNSLKDLLEERLLDGGLAPPSFLIDFYRFEAFGQLVLLSFDISAFIPVAYQRHRL